MEGIRPELDEQRVQDIETWADGIFEQFCRNIIWPGYISVLGYRLKNGSPYAIGPLSVCPVSPVCPNGWMD